MGIFPKLERTTMAKRVYRSQEDRMIAGVCGGIAERFDWDPVWVRLATVFLVFIHGIGIIAYIVAWIVMPDNPNQSPKRTNTVKKAAKTVKHDIKAAMPEKKAKTGSVKAAKNIRKDEQFEQSLRPKRRGYGWLITIGIIFFVLAGVAAAGFIAQEIFCEKSSGNIIQESRDVSDFNKVEMQGAGDLIITQGENYSVVLETDDNLMNKYTTRVIGDRLVISTDHIPCFIGNKGLVVYVTMPDVKRLTVDGSGDIISMNTITSDELEIQISGSGNIDLDVDVSSLETRIDGSGDATYKGRATDHAIHVAGSGDIYAYGLSTQSTSVEIAGSGDAEITAYETLDVNVAGSGDIYYQGEPQVSQSIAGSGNVRQITR